jgi:hypothetical protein
MRISERHGSDSSRQIEGRVIGPVVESELSATVSGQGYQLLSISVTCRLSTEVAALAASKPKATLINCPLSWWNG